MYRKYKCKPTIDYLYIGPLRETQAKEWIMDSENRIVSIDGNPYSDVSVWSIGGGQSWVLLGESNKLEDLLVKKTHFEKDEYIVCLNCESTTFTPNFVFQQRERNTYIRPYSDCKGSSNNGSPVIAANSTNWRPATPEEIRMYNNAGRPVDVTLKPRGEVFPNVFVGDVVIWDAESSSSFSLLKNEFLIVHEKSKKDCLVIFKNGKQLGGYWTTFQQFRKPNAAEMEIYKKVGVHGICKEEEKPKEIDIREILEEAKKRYPKGTKVNLFAGSDGINTTRVINDTFIVQRMGISYCGLPGYVYWDGKWADIVLEEQPPLTKKPSRDKLLAEASKRFPLGCSYYDHNGTIRHNAGKPYHPGDSNNIALKSGDGCVYHDGKWKGVLFNGAACKTPKSEPHDYFYYESSPKQEHFIKDINSVNTVLVKKKKKVHF